MIRPATEADCETIAKLGEIFHAEAAWSDICAFDAADCQITLERMSRHPEAILLVAEKDGRIIGMAGGLISPLYFNHRHMTGQELFWWIDPKERGSVGVRLLEALEDEARRMGCSSWAMIALDKVEPERTARIYQRRGYRASERTFIKRL
jgi:GNAT superfamily N-acetyltransferase